MYAFDRNEGECSNYTLTFNTSTSKLELGAITSFGMNFAMDVGEWLISKIPGHPDLRMITRRIGYNAHSMNGSKSVVVTTSGAIHMTPTQMPVITSLANRASHYGHLVPMPGDRLLATGLNEATIYAIDYTNKTYSVISNGQFSLLGTNDNLGRYIFPLDSNYWFMMTRSNLFSATAGVRGKVVRMVDDKLIEQNASSSDNDGNGYTMAGTPATFLNAQYRPPELINGKVFYWGYDANAQSGNVTKLSWTIIDIGL
jgi:hypothetical protein